MCMVDRNPCSFIMQATVSQKCVYVCMSALAPMNENNRPFLKRLPDFNTGVLLSLNLAEEN